MEDETYILLRFTLKVYLNKQWLSPSRLNWWFSKLGAWKLSRLLAISEYFINYMPISRDRDAY
jgi:hypothetical protein